MKKLYLTLFLAIAATSSFSQDKKIAASKNCYKPIENSNPISSNIFLADPTGIEYKGRLYVYGTSDHQQYISGSLKNTYEKITSIEMFSTDDMVNWEYHGAINVKAIAPWIYNSWAPSICSRIEDDGLTHFYMYFSNSGCGVGVITATNPLGPWCDPRGSALIHTGTPQLGDVPNPFDPGVCIDDNGVGFLGFGGGIAKSGNEAMPHTARIARLGKDMISVDSIARIHAPYFYEASEMNFVNGTYIYTFNNNWAARTEWNFNDGPEPSQCSMAYMTTRTPLDTDSWEYRSHYFKNPGDQGLCYSNNHTHFMQFNGTYYLLYHAMLLHEAMLGRQNDLSFRSICIDRMDVSENDARIAQVQGTRSGVKPIKNFDPFERHSGATMCTSADIAFDTTRIISSTTTAAGAWIGIRAVAFDKPANAISITAQGEGVVEVRLDKLNSDPVARINVSSSEPATYKAALSVQPSGKHRNMFFVFSDKGMNFHAWQCE